MFCLILKKLLIILENCFYKWRINNEKYTGFTYHYIDENIDTGNIILQKKTKINDYDTGGGLYMKVMLEATNHFEYVLKKVTEGYKGIPQKSDGKYYRRDIGFRVMK